MPLLFHNISGRHLFGSAWDAEKLNRALAAIACASPSSFDRPRQLRFWLGGLGCQQELNLKERMSRPVCLCGRHARRALCHFDLLVFEAPCFRRYSGTLLIVGMSFLVFLSGIKLLQSVEQGLICRSPRQPVLLARVASVKRQAPSRSRRQLRA